MLKSFIYQFSTLLNQIHKCPKPSGLYKLFINNQEQYNYEHYITTIKRLQTLLPQQKEDPLQKVFGDNLLHFIKQCPKAQQWTLMIQLSKLQDDFKEQVDYIGVHFLREGQFQNLHQVAILCWCLSKCHIKRIKAMEKLVVFIEKQFKSQKLVLKGNPNEPIISDELIDEFSFVDEDTNTTSTQRKGYDYQLNDSVYEFRDLVLIIWSLRELRLNQTFLVQTALQLALQQDNAQHIILLLYSTNYQKIDKLINLLQIDCFSKLTPEQLKGQNVLTLIQLTLAIGNLKYRDLNFASGLVDIILSKHEKQAISPKFLAQIIWSLKKYIINSFLNSISRAGYEDYDLFHKLGLQVESIIGNMNKGIDLAQCFSVYCDLARKYPGRFQNLIRIMKDRSNLIQMDPRSKEIMDEKHQNL